MMGKDPEPTEQASDTNAAVVNETKPTVPAPSPAVASNGVPPNPYQNSRPPQLATQVQAQEDLTVRENEKRVSVVPVESAEVPTVRQSQDRVRLSIAPNNVESEVQIPSPTALSSKKKVKKAPEVKAQVQAQALTFRKSQDSPSTDSIGESQAQGEASTQKKTRKASRKSKFQTKALALGKITKSFSTQKRATVAPRESQAQTEPSNQKEKAKVSRKSKFQTKARNIAKIKRAFSFQSTKGVSKTSLKSVKSQLQATARKSNNGSLKFPEELQPNPDESNAADAPTVPESLEESDAKVKNVSIEDPKNLPSARSIGDLVLYNEYGKPYIDVNRLVYNPPKRYTKDKTDIQLSVKVCWS
jgi:hypothetical protein